MNIDDKRKSINDIERLINDRENKISKKRKEIAKIQEEINTLKKLYERIGKSDFKALLFKIDTTHPMPDDEDEMETTYIIYDVESDKIYNKTITGKNRNKIPEDLTDYTDLFKELGMPNRIWPDKPMNNEEYLEIIKKAYIILNTYVNEVRSKYNCQTWEEVKAELEMEVFSKDTLNFHIIPEDDLYFKNK